MIGVGNDMMTPYCICENENRVAPKLISGAGQSN